MQVADISVFGDVDLFTLKATAERVRDELTAIPGITQVEIVSAPPYEISIEVSELTLRRHGLTFDQIADAVRRSSLDLPGGSVRTEGGEILLRTIGQAYRGTEYENLVLWTRADGSRRRCGRPRETVVKAEAVVRVKSSVDAITTFPVETEKPIVRELTSRMQVTNIAVSGDVDPFTLKAVTERVRDELTAIPGITQVDIISAPPYEISIEVSEVSLRRHGLTFDQIADAVRRSSLDLPGGSVRTEAGEILLRTIGQAYRARSTKTSCSGPVFRTGEQSALEIAALVHDYIDEAQTRTPDGISLTICRDTAKMLSARLSLMLRTGATGFLLVFITLALFLDLRLALWVSLGIPISFLGAIALMPSLDSLHQHHVAVRLRHSARHRRRRRHYRRRERLPASGGAWRRAPRIDRRRAGDRQAGYLRGADDRRGVHAAAVRAGHDGEDLPRHSADCHSVFALFAHRVARDPAVPSVPHQETG